MRSSSGDPADARPGSGDTKDMAHQAFLSSQGAERLELSPAETTAFVLRDRDAMVKLLVP